VCVCVVNVASMFVSCAAGGLATPSRLGQVLCSPILSYYLPYLNAKLQDVGLVHV
jgi:hypothetical protein